VTPAQEVTTVIRLTIQKSGLSPSDSNDDTYTCIINNLDPSNSKGTLVQSIYKINDKNDIFYINDPNEMEIAIVPLFNKTPSFDAKNLIIDYYTQSSLILTPSKKEEWKMKQRLKWYDHCNSISKPYHPLNPNN